MYQTASIRTTRSKDDKVPFGDFYTYPAMVEAGNFLVRIVFFRDDDGVNYIFWGIGEKILTNVKDHVTLCTVADRGRTFHE